MSYQNSNRMAKQLHGMITLLCTCMIMLTLFYYSELWRYSNNKSYVNNSLQTFENHNKNKDLQYSAIDPSFKTLWVAEYLISTPGCHIPRTEMNFTNLVVENPSMAALVTCRIPLVNASKNVDGHVELKVINASIPSYFNYTSDFSHCCYRIVSRVDKNDKNITRSSCKEFNETTLVEGSDDFLSVECFGKNGSQVFVDNLAFVNKKQIEINTDSGWSVLVLGVDTMSRARLQKEMPNLAAYFRKNYWLDFEGYQKVADNTFPNLMSVLTGNNESYSYGSCQSNINQCSKKMIWSLYKDKNYVTAYGEDHLRLPDTFSRYDGFIQPPTDHYMRPFFLMGEEEKTIHGFKVLCSGSKMAGERVLDYASDFARTYLNSLSFGFFWMNSFSHNPVNSPSVMDAKMILTLETLSNIGVTNNTFVIFLSDHGIRFGDSRKQMESYYEERLPALLMWVPTQFRELFPEIYEKIRMNTLRLVTPYDLYMTLQDILHLSTSEPEYKIKLANGCPKCNSLFQEVDIGRTCEDASVTPKWCTCHTLESAELNRRRFHEAIKSINFVIHHMNNNTKQCEIEKCWYCADYSLKDILRTHFYTERDKSYYVVAFSVSPGTNIYEATVSRDGIDGFEIVGPISFISKYSGSGACAKKANYRAFCYCVNSSDLEECREI